MPYWEWNPFEEIENMRKRMRKATHGFLAPVGDEFFEGTFPVDIIESKDSDEMTIKADLPGFNKEDVAVKVTENSIEIEARHKERKIEKTEKMFKAEKSFGMLKRFLTLPAEVKPESANVKMENGVLEVKLEKMQPKKKAKEIKAE